MDTEHVTARPRRKRRKKRKGLRVVLSIILVLGFLVGVVSLVFTLKSIKIVTPLLFEGPYIESSVRTAYGDNYKYIEDYNAYQIFDRLVVSPKFVNRLTATEYSNLTSMTEVVSSLEGFAYNEDNASPKRLLSEGGNCQALTLYVYDWCILNDVLCEIFYIDVEHMYCIVTEDLGDTINYYKFDTSSGVISIDVRSK